MLQVCSHIRILVALLCLCSIWFASADFVNSKGVNVNVRYGPGLYYPIKFILLKRNMPLQTLQEFDEWLEVRSFDDNVGWIHKNLVNRKRYAFIRGDCYGYNKATLESKKIAVIDKGVVVLVKKCRESFCRVSVDNLSFWIEKRYLWGDLS